MHVVVPLKDFDFVKQRLASCLSPIQRRNLFYAMVKDVLSALSATEFVEGVFLLSDDPLASELSQRFDATLLLEAPLLAKRGSQVQRAKGNLNAALSAAVLELQEKDIASVMILHGDLPFVSPDELDALIAHYREKSAAAVAVVSDYKGQGTNAMVFDSRHPPILAFGAESFYNHQESAKNLGLEFIRLSYQGIEKDIDEPSDLEALALQRNDDRAYFSREFFKSCELPGQDSTSSSLALP